MINIIIEMFPKGNEKKKYILASGKVWNTGSGTDTKGVYDFSLNLKKKKGKYSGTITGFNRKRYTVWVLLYLILKDALSPGGTNAKVK